MKPLIAFLFLLLPVAVAAQEGTVLYEQTTKMDFKLPPEMEHMRAQIPSSQTTNKLLFYNEAAALMKNGPKEETDDTEVSGTTFRFRMQAPDNETFTGFEDGQVVRKQDFMGRTFLITDESEPLAWKMTGEQSEFLGHLCLKAVAMRDTVAVEAWFTPEIPVPAGPEGYGGLPGLILVLTEDEGRVSYVAKEITPTVPAGIIQPPSEGRKVTRAEFRAIVEEKMKEMGVSRGRGGNIIIRH